MPRTTPHIVVPAVIRKSEIDSTIPSMGKRNSHNVTLDGVSYIAGEVVYLHFCGAIDLADGLYHGQHVYRLAKPTDKDTPSADLNTLPPQSTLKSAKATPKEVTHGV